MSVTAKALWFIESHLDASLSLDAIAGAVHVSRFHLSRAFATATGQPLSGYVRARRLSHAAGALAQGAPDILTLAVEAGYGSHEAFTRAFRQHFDMTPEQVRAQAQVDIRKLQEPLRMQTSTNTKLDPPRLASLDALLIFGLSQRHASSSAGIPAQWGRFVPHLGQIAHQSGKETYGVVYNADDSAGCDYLCGVQVTQFPAQPAEFTRLRIPPHTYAVFTHRDHVSTIGATWQAIYNQALPEAGHTAADGRSFERYGPEFDGRTGLGGCEIWIPIALRS